MKSVSTERQASGQMKSYTVTREERDKYTYTPFKSGIWFDSFPHGPLFFPSPRFQLFNECLHSSCYCRTPCSKLHISLHFSTHYGANALRPSSFLFLRIFDSFRDCVHPICEALKFIRCRLLPVLNNFLSARRSSPLFWRPLCFL